MDPEHNVTTHAVTPRDFTNLEILTDLYKSLEMSLKSHLTTSGLYMGACLLLAWGSQLIVFPLQAPACKFFLLVDISSG